MQSRDNHGRLNVVRLVPRMVSTDAEIDTDATDSSGGANKLISVKAITTAAGLDPA